MSLDPEVWASLDELERSALRRLAPSRAWDAGCGWPRPGERFDDFVLEREIGRGSTGLVYQARQISSGRVVALKLQVLATPSEEGPRGRSRREAESLTALRHPAIVPVYAAGVASGLRFLAMELIEGGTLRDVMEGRALGLPRRGDAAWAAFALNLIERIADALGAAHAAGWVHRDVKPENVLVSAAGRPYLADFGLARTEGGVDTSWTRGFVGTPRYASPEQVRGEPLDSRSDVFSLGAVAFELFTGGPAFGGADAREVMRRIEFDDLRWPGAPRAPRELAAVIERCVEKDPRRRYADGAAAAREFGRLQRFEPVEAELCGPVRRAVRRMARPGTRRAAAGVGLLLCASTWLGVSEFRARSAWRAAAAAEFERVQLEFEEGRFERVEQQLASLSPGGERELDLVRLLADARLWSGRPEAALQCYERALVLDPSSEADRIGAAACRGVALPASALGSSARAHALGGLAYERAGCASDAVDALRIAVELRPNAVAWKMALARVLRSEGRRVEALSMVQQAAVLRPDAPWIACERARILIEQERFHEAAAVARAALKDSPDDGCVMAELANAELCMRRRLESSLDLAQHAYELAPSDPRVVRILAGALALNGDRVGALAIVREFARVHGDHYETEVALGRCALSDGDVGAALECAARARGLPSDDGGRIAWRLAATAGLAAGDKEAALAAYAELRRIDPESTMWPTQEAQLLLDMGRAEEAVASLAGLARRQLRDARLQALCGEALRAVGDFEAALTHFDRARHADPRDPQASYCLARAWYEVGEPRAALKNLQSALDSAAPSEEALELERRCVAALGETLEHLETPRAVRQRARRRHRASSADSR